ncbi:MAG: tripartite tricarboxylate transporter substrate binding protein [Rhizobiales bacterium]|nr:tripartite tricarboxylate transporter substrate binding protein [Hyphomicrobiales bacterium]
MTLVRRQLLQIAAGAAALPIASHFARADAFPDRPVHVVIGFPPGGIGSFTVGLIGESFQQKLGQPLVVDYHPGAGGNIGTALATKAAADGYTILSTSPSNAISATLYKNLPFDFIRDMAMVAGIIRAPLVLLTNPSFEAKSLSDLIAYAKANPGKLNMASSGNGSTPHLAGELFKMMTGLAMVHVPYAGEAPALADLIAGRTQVMFANVTSAIGFIRDRRLRALAVTAATASPALPGILPIASAVPGYDVSAWYALSAPRATPAATITTLNKAINASLAEPAIVNRIIEVGGAPMVQSPSELDAFVVAETKKWAEVVRFSGAQVD